MDSEQIPDTQLLSIWWRSQMRFLIVKDLATEPGSAWFVALWTRLILYALILAHQNLYDGFYDEENGITKKITKTDRIQGE